ncbi:MAG: hypothetical protein ACTSRG_11975 [Candidatus Helarchaeota archaeon]
MEGLERQIKNLVENIDNILIKIYESTKKFEINEFSKLVANYNRFLNSLLSNYHEKKELQSKLKPYTMFYRQFFQELMFIISQESVPHEYLERIRQIIDQKNELIENYYNKRAKTEIDEIKKVSKKLEKFLKKRFELRKMLEKQKKVDYYS